MTILAILAPVTLAATPIAAAAQAPADPPPPPRSTEERICRTSGELGSRLTRTRTCRSRAQWDETRREQRTTIDRAQRQWNPTVDGAISQGN